MRRFFSSLSAVAFVTVVACSAYDLSPLTDGACSAETKACEVKGILSCVAKTDPKTGCARTACLPCSLAHTDVTICDPTGECAIGACAVNFTDCDPATPGCETETAFDVNNCGACGTVCPPVPNASLACNNGVCGLGTCVANFGNCDGNPSNGCETNFLTSTAHCGKCNNPCSGTCTNGTCS